MLDVSVLRRLLWPAGAIWSISMSSVRRLVPPTPPSGADGGGNAIRSCCWKLVVAEEADDGVEKSRLLEALLLGGSTRVTGRVAAAFLFVDVGAAGSGGGAKLCCLMAFVLEMAVGTEAVGRLRGCDDGCSGVWLWSLNKGEGMVKGPGVVDVFCKRWYCNDGRASSSS